MAFYLMSMFVFTHQISAQGPCDFINYTVEKYEPCCFRLHVDNSLIECYNELLLTIDAGTYTGFKANTATGWSIDQISPTEILMKHNSGRIPLGLSMPGTFCLEPGFDPLLSITWDNICDLLGCFRDIPLTGCPTIADACIEGVKYRECNQANYTNQTPIPNYTIILSDANGSVIRSTETDLFGEYSFCDLPAGNYVVREVNQQGWTPNIPASGRYNVTLLQSEIAIRNFGNCPECSCDSIFTDVVPIELELDTCTYAILINDSDGFCFDSFSLRITPGKGYLSSWTILDSEWKVTQVDSQNLNFRLSRTNLIGWGIIFKVSGNPEHEISLSSWYNVGGNDFECKKVFNFECPRIKIPTNCCPIGSTQGPELVKNGNFEKTGVGPVDFTPCYTWFNPGNPGSPGKYSVLQSNQVFAANSKWSCLEHTANSFTGKMLVVDGQHSTCNFVWQELLPVQPGLQYAFCAFVNNLVIPGKNLINPIVELRVNNTLIQTITLPQSPDQWESISGLWLAGTITSALVEIRIISMAGDGNDFAVDDISFRSCLKMDTCICGPFEFLYSIGRGPLLPKNCGDTLYVPSSTAITPIRFLSSFQCSGSLCPPSKVDWILTGPPGFIPLSMNGVLPTPDFTIPINNSTFTLPGLYTLTMTGHCGTHLCTCTIYFNADGRDCCINEPDFELAIKNAVTITVDNTKCKATLSIGNLPKCDFIQSIQWGDGFISNGPFLTGSMSMHTYNFSGTYVINYFAIETDPLNSLKCFEKTFQDTIRLVCDTCICKSFSPLSFFNPSWPVATAPVFCGATMPIQLSCTKPGQNFLFHGNLNCSADYCIKDSIHWNLANLNSGQIISSGISQTDLSNGHFDITLNPIWFNSNILYEINLTGHCGPNTCTCKIRFTFDECACNCDSLATDVNQGFFVSGNGLNCKRTLKPKALCPNDVVTWLVSGPSLNQQFGPGTGNNSQIIPFPLSGNYSVCMLVTRIDPITHDSCQIEYCRNVKVKCSPPDPTIALCPTNSIRNGDITEGRIEGHMGKSNGGKIGDWNLFPNTGDGLVYVSDSAGLSDDGYIILVGNKNNFAGIWQQVDLPVDNFINIGFDLLDFQRKHYDLIKPDIVFRLQNEPTLHPGSSTEIVRKAMKENLKDLQRSYQRFDTTINFQHNPDLKYLVICLQNQSDSVYSAIGIDNIEICTSKIPLSAYSELLGKLRIYPNPSNGHFTIEMQQAATTGMKFRIIDVTGRSVLEKQTNVGSQIQNIDANNLSSGFYLLQVISKGKVLAVEKLMKQ